MAVLLLAVHNIEDQSAPVVFEEASPCLRAPPAVLQRLI